MEITDRNEGIDPEATQESPSLRRGWSDDITHRQRVLLYSEPLFRLKIRGDARLTEDHELGHYDSMALVFKIFDLVIETMGLEGELDMGGIAYDLQPLLSAMDEAEGKEPNAERHQRAVGRVLDWLLNEEGKREPFRVEYMDFGDGMEAERRVMDVTLLSEQFTPTGHSVPRLSPEATNLYLNAIHFPIEDRQLAFEAMIREQIARGRLTEAERSARASLALSVEYKNEVEMMLRATQRDIRQVDWVDDAPTKLRTAQTHVHARVLAERDILDAAEDKLNHLAAGSTEAQHMARVIRLMELCFKQHSRLEERLISAFPTFLDEHARQAFAARRPAAALQLGREVLEPYMRLTRQDALDLADNMIAAFSPIETPTVFWLDDLVTRLLQPRRETRGHTALVVEREIIKIGEEQVRFDPRAWAAAGRWLQTVEVPTRLADLLDRASAAGEETDVVELIALRVLFLFAPDEEDCAMVADKTGDVFRFGRFQGDNLVLRKSREDAVTT